MALAATRSISGSETGSERRRIAIVGGGLAGLSTTYHLLNESRHGKLDITVLDKEPEAGIGGASAVAGG